LTSINAFFLVSFVKKPKYNKHPLLELVKQFKPTCAAHWRSVAQAYQERTGEAELREPSSLKMCNNTTKPTGGGNQMILDSQIASHFNSAIHQPVFDPIQHIQSNIQNDDLEEGDVDEEEDV
jgi:hypothetical protein